LKKIIFLIIASLLVIGLVLPGCDGGNGILPRERPVVAGEINIAVCGPMDDVQGEHHWYGATMARDEINALPNKINLGGTPHTLVLTKVDTNEVAGLPDEGVLALKAAIADVDLVVGGFRTEAVSAYRLEAMSEEVLFLNCGAATAALQASVVTDYSDFKYWFKATPYNEVFLVTSMLKLTGSAVASLVGNLLAYHAGGAGYPWTDGDYAITGSGTHEDPFEVKIAIFGESLSWAAGIVEVAEEKLPTLILDSKNITMDVVGTWLVSDTKTDVGTEIGEIAAAKPHVVFTIFSGPVGKVYSKARADSGLPALSLGINVEGQLQGMVDYTADGCEFDIMLDTWGYGVEQTTLTGDFLDTFMSSSYAEDYPLYTAATYDAIYSLKATLEAVGIDPDDMITYMEDISNGLMGVGATNTTYYPMPAGVGALSEAQVLEYYPWLDGLTIKNYGEAPTTWAYNASDWEVEDGFIAHDTVYGPAYQTGMGTQWQDVEGTLRKVGWWPTVIPGLEALDGLSPELIPAMYQAGMWESKVLDQYGNWNFAYNGQTPLQLPLGWWLTGAPTVEYDGTPVA
jgi:branched-chain amino acid transport system substrate-binding protein